MSKILHMNSHIISSWPILQYFQVTWTVTQNMMLCSHLKGCNRICVTRNKRKQKRPYSRSQLTQLHLKNFIQRKTPSLAYYISPWVKPKASLFRPKNLLEKYLDTWLGDLVRIFFFNWPGLNHFIVMKIKRN